MRYVTLLLIVLMVAYTSAFDVMRVAMPNPICDFGDLPVWVIDSSNNERKELYLG